jgi:hypothetical protein
LDFYIRISYYATLNHNATGNLEPLAPATELILKHFHVPDLEEAAELALIDSLLILLKFVTPPMKKPTGRRFEPALFSRNPVLVVLFARRAVSAAHIMHPTLAVVRAPYLSRTQSLAAVLVAKRATGNVPVVKFDALLPPISAIDQVTLPLPLTLLEVPPMLIFLAVPQFAVVMGAVPSKAVPLMFLAVASFVAAAAVPLVVRPPISDKSWAGVLVAISLVVDAGFAVNTGICVAADAVAAARIDSLPLLSMNANAPLLELDGPAPTNPVA